MKIDDFIRLEVQHQGFDLETIDGQQRVEWMNEAWNAAQDESAEKPSFGFIEYLGALVERNKNRNGFRTALNVRVGNRFAPHYDDVYYLMELLCHWEPTTEQECLEWYRCFEIIHPFEGGNGRVGKILLCWLNDTLDDPEMPQDLFGGGVP